MRNRKGLALVLALCVAAGSLSGCGSRAKVTEDMIPTVTDLKGEASLEAGVETAAEVLGLAMNTSYLSELTRLDGDNTEAAAVADKEIQVVMKATSVDKDLKIKFVNEKNGRVITGTAFSVEVTDPEKKKKAYTDDDKDGIIYIQKLAGGSYKVTMNDAKGFDGGAPITATVKGKIEYAMIDVTDEIKKESEINVAQEDGAYGGSSQDSSTTPQTLKDTVEYVESTKTPIYEEGNPVQKKDAFGQPMYSKQKTDKYGQLMYAKYTVPEHKDADGDGKCDRCGTAMPHTHSYTEWQVVKEATCTEAGVKQPRCSCGAVDTSKSESIPALGHVDSDKNEICDRCGAQLEHIHTYTEVRQEPTCTEPGKILMKCACGDIESSESISPLGHTDADGNGKCDRCGEVMEVPAAPASDSVPGEPSARLSMPSWVIPSRMLLVTAAASTKSCKPVYDTSSAPVYDTSSEPIYEEKKIIGYKYTGWQTIDGKTYYYDKNGNRVTGTQVIQGVQYTFDDGGDRSGAIGIDVSKYQRSIDWKQVKNAGIEFVYIRCGYRGYGSGVLVEDPMFRSHISGARAAGLKVGVYFFSQAVTEAEAVEEASMAVSLVKSAGGVNLPIAIDSEYAAGGAGRADGLSASSRTAITKAFCNTIANSGYTPMVYASKSWFGSHLNVSSLSSYRIWVAHYAAACGYTGRYDVWQYTSKGSVPGVSGNVDMNISYM